MFEQPFLETEPCVKWIEGLSKGRKPCGLIARTMVFALTNFVSQCESYQRKGLARDFYLRSRLIVAWAPSCRKRCFKGSSRPEKRTTPVLDRARSTVALGARRVAVSRPLGRSIDGCELKLLSWRKWST